MYLIMQTFATTVIDNLVTQLIIITKFYTSTLI